MNCHSNIWLVQLIYTNLGLISLGGAAVAWISHIIYYRAKGFTLTLNATIAKITAGAALPPALAMLGAAVDPANLLGCVSELGLYIFIGAVSVIWITWTVLFPKSIETTKR